MDFNQGFTLTEIVTLFGVGGGDILQYGVQ